MEATCQRYWHTYSCRSCGHTHDQQGTGFLILSVYFSLAGYTGYLQLPLRCSGS